MPTSIPILTGQFYLIRSGPPRVFRFFMEAQNRSMLLNVVNYWRYVLGTTERRERERQELRSRILDAARELFAEQGYDAVTMRGIAERIEYSPTAIYFHFKDKE